MDARPHHATTGTRIVAVRLPRLMRSHFLELIEGGGSLKRFELSADEIVAGRTETADLKLDSPRVSRRHALFNRTGDEFTVRDFGSRNGIYLNSLRVNSAVLRDGDVVQIADHVFVYREE